MKTAIYIEDGIVQLVITPESAFEKNALSSFQARPLDARIFEGTFYDCRGGWTRQAEYYANSGIYGSVYGRNETDKSLILRIAEPEMPSELEGSESKQPVLESGELSELERKEAELEVCHAIANVAGNATASKAGPAVLNALLERFEIRRKV